MIIYYSLTLNGIYYVRWTRPLRVLFPFALQTGQKVREMPFLIERSFLRGLGSSNRSKYFPNITHDCQCDVSICSLRIYIHIAWCWHSQEQVHSFLPILTHSRFLSSFSSEI